MLRPLLLLLALLLAVLGAPPRAAAKLVAPEKLAPGFFAPPDELRAVLHAPPALQLQWFSGDEATNFAPGLRKFISADPMGFSESANFYWFANGDPVSLVDPFGLGAQDSSGST